MHAAPRLVLAGFLVALVSLAAGCEREPRIDATSDQAIENSVDDIASRMSANDAETFRAAVQVLVMYEMTQVMDADDGLSPQQKMDQVTDRMQARLHNATANEVIDQVLTIAAEEGVE